MLKACTCSVFLSGLEKLKASLRKVSKSREKVNHALTQKIITNYWKRKTDRLAKRKNNNVTP